MFKLIAVTNRGLCDKDFLSHLKLLAKNGITTILRAKELDDGEYFLLAKEALEIYKKYGTKCILHEHIRCAEKLGADALHLSLDSFLKNAVRTGAFKVKGASVHSLSGALSAQQGGADYITLGHIYKTECKKGLSPRGTAFLKDVCGKTEIPVYAIGGITPERLAEVKAAGAAGACVMSGLMTSQGLESFGFDSE